MKKPVYDILDCGPRHRFCANGKLVHNSNFQNFKKPDPDMPRDEALSIRDAIVAPEGYILVKPDAAQIECRCLNFIAGQWDVIDRFRNHEDPYVNVASEFYKRPINKKDHPKERQVGKVLELQAGYGSGGPKIGATLRIKAGIVLSPEDALKARDAYRDTHPEVVALWKTAGRMIARLAGGPPTTWGPCEVRNHRIYLPNGCPLIYDTLEFHKDPETGEGNWRMLLRKYKTPTWSKMYGAKLVENLIQAIARVIISQIFIRVARMGYRIVSMEHDSLWILIPRDGKEKQHLDVVAAEFRKAPTWLPGIPLDCDATLE